MDKSWVDMPRNTAKYLNGLDKFLDFTFENRSVDGAIRCPCPKCHCNKWATRNVVSDYLICKQFPRNYKVWIWHGETYETVASRDIEAISKPLQNENPVIDMINDAFRINECHDMDDDMNEGLSEFVETMLNEENEEIVDLLRNGKQDLYEGCQKYSKLSFLLRLYHIKCLCGMTDKAMIIILKLLKDAFEYANILPSFYEAKKVIYKLGLNYTKIDACAKNCMLYWGEDEILEICKHCNKSRWKAKCTNGKKKVPAKILRYFFLKPRLQMLFACPKTAKSMRWHALNSKPDRLLRHPRYANTWSFDQNPEFASEPRNVRLGLASDGFNPF